MLARILSTCVVLAVGLAPAAAQDKPRDAGDAAPAVTSEQAAAAAKTLKEGLASQDTTARVTALREAAAVDHDEVAKVVGGVLTEKDESVRIAAADVLGGMSCKESLTALHRGAEKKKNIEDSKVAAALFKAIGRHAEVSSIMVIANEPLKNMDADVVKARIFALGNIRSKKSVEELMKLMQLGNPTPGQDSAYMPMFRVALARLTGTDQTTNKDMWQTWWRENEKTFEVAEPPIEMAPELQALWNEYWGVPATDKAAGEREKSASGRG
jgi:HEAT repeat protein